LYLKAFNNGAHPFTIAEVVTRAGIVRIGPLQNCPAPTKAPGAAPVKTPTVATTTKATALGTTNKKPNRRPIKRPTLRPTKLPSASVVKPQTHENKVESPEHDDSD
jgi:hypothetical protein